MNNAQTLTVEELATLYRKEPKQFNITETAKIIRAELKKTFPDTKFSVRTQRYSMGSHVNVGYTDGPPVHAVEAVTNRFYGRGFDGMTDSTTFHDSDYQGERVHFAGSRPSVSRNYSAGWRNLVDQAMTILGRQWNPNTGAAWSDKRDIETAAYAIVARLDLRWETVERGVSRFLATGCQWYT